MQTKYLPLFIPACCVAMFLATPAISLAQCCQKSASGKETPPNSAPQPAGNSDSKSDGATAAANRAEWLLHATRRISEQFSRLVEKVTYADYSTQWSSWCAGNRGGSSQPCTPKCCEKPAPGKSQTPDSRCCRQPCPTQGAQSGNKFKGS